MLKWLNYTKWHHAWGCLTSGADQLERRLIVVVGDEWPELPDCNVLRLETHILINCRDKSQYAVCTQSHCESLIHLGHDPEEAVSVGGGGHNGSLVEGSRKVSGRAAPSGTHVDGIPEFLAQLLNLRFLVLPGDRGHLFWFCSLPGAKMFKSQPSLPIPTFFGTTYFSRFHWHDGCPPVLDSAYDVRDQFLGRW